MTYILFNRLANNGNGEASADQAVKFFGDCKKIDYVGTDISEFFKNVTADDRIILCGGDGTVNRFANDAFGVDVPCPVLLYKSGTGNDFLKDIGKDDAKQAVDISEYIKHLPTVTINGKTTRYINGIGFGIDGMVCQVADDLKAKGKKDINYALLSVKLLFKFKCPDATVTVDGKVYSYKKVWLASAMNGKYYGGGMKVAPDQDRRSGKLTCVVWHGTGRLKTLMRFSGIFKGEHIKHAEMCDVITGNDIKVTFSLPTALQIDGETVRNVTEYEAIKAVSEAALQH